MSKVSKKQKTEIGHKKSESFFFLSYPSPHPFVTCIIHSPGKKRRKEKKKKRKGGGDEVKASHSCILSRRGCQTRLLLIRNAIMVGGRSIREKRRRTALIGVPHNIPSPTYYTDDISSCAILRPIAETIWGNVDISRQKEGLRAKKRILFPVSVWQKCIEWPDFFFLVR